MIVYTQGSFDLLHIGHINLFRRCREIAGDNGKVIVALLSDEAYKKYRGYYPTIPFNQRKTMIESCRYVDVVFESNNLNTKLEVTDYGANAIVVGSDWATKDLAKQYGVSEEWLNPKLIYVPYTKDVSSTEIKNKLSEKI
jgi:glycerol-3-phosphate cytidylyltransferase